MRKYAMAAVLAAVLLAPMAGCETSYRDEATGAVLYKNAAMNCPACAGNGFYSLGPQRVRCYHCRGIGLVMGWSGIKPGEEVYASSYAITDKESDEESGD